MRIVQGLVLVALLVLTGASTTLAQRNPLVGAWSMRTATTYGQATGTIFTTFYEDGRFAQRWVIPGGTFDYRGSYALSSDRGVIQWIYRDYNPKGVPPMVQMNTPFNTQVRWISENIFLTEDAGGTNRWVRQR